MSDRNIVLIGFMGAGKTSVSKKLAQRLGRTCVSTDEVIEEREQRSISTIFIESGEAYFRKIEMKVVAEFASKPNLVIDCGGGVVLHDENIDRLRRKGIIIYIRLSPAVVCERIKETRDRPLLEVADSLVKITALLAQRASCYEKADFIIDADTLSVNQLVEQISRLA